MTRNSEIDCEDLFYCGHEPETPILGQDGETSHWLCRCGRSVVKTKQPATVVGDAASTSTQLEGEK